MKAYSPVFFFNYADFDIEITPHHTFVAKDDEEALKKVERLQSSVRLVSYYDKVKDDIVIDIGKNEYFHTIMLPKFLFYDGKKAGYLTIQLSDGTSIYPVVNPNCFVSLTKIQFIEMINEQYKELFSRDSRINFDFISFGIRLAEE